MGSHYTDMRQAAGAFVDAVNDALETHLVDSGIAEWLAEEQETVLERDGLRFGVDASNQTVHSPVYNDTVLTEDVVIRDVEAFETLPESFEGIEHESVVETYGQLQEAIELFTDAASLSDVIKAIVETDDAALSHIFEDIDETNSEISNLLDLQPDEPVFRAGRISVFVPTSTDTISSQTRTLRQPRNPDDLLDGRGRSGNRAPIAEPETERTFDDLFEEIMRSEADDAYVVGEDDTPTGFFVHHISADDLPQDLENMTVEDVYDAMGFDKQPWDESVNMANLDQGTRVRLQGDLAIERVNDSTVTDAEHERIRREATEEEFEERLADEAAKRGLADIDVNVSGGDETPPSVTVRHGSIESLTDFLGIEGHLGDGGGPSRADPERRRDALQTLAEQELQAHAEHIVADVRQQVSEEMDKNLDEILDIEQANLPIDNHLVIVGSGEVISSRDSPPVRVRIPTETSLNCLHDEHEQVSLQIGSGVYRLYLLPRGGTRTQPINSGGTNTRDLMEEMNDEMPGLFENDTEELDNSQESRLDDIF